MDTEEERMRKWDNENAGLLIDAKEQMRLRAELRETIKRLRRRCSQLYLERSVATGALWDIRAASDPKALPYRIATKALDL
jgi:hypothetical protein